MDNASSLFALRNGPLTPDQLVEAASNTNLEIDVLSAGGASSRLTCVRSALGWSIDIATVNAHVRAVGALDPRCVALLVVDQPGDTNICGAFLDRSMALVMPVGTEIAAGIRPGFAYTTVVLPAAHWHHGLALAGAAVPLAPVAVELSPAAAWNLAREGRRLAAGLTVEGRVSGEGVPSPILDYAASFAEACGLVGNGRLDHDRSARLRQAWAAHDYLRLHLAEDVSVGELCRRLAISRRQLEYAFRTVFDSSPREFLLSLRLNESRRRLMKARDRGQTVTQVAMDVGISHLGRYAACYRRLFGETPSQTLQRGGRA